MEAVPIPERLKGYESRIGPFTIKMWLRLGGVLAITALLGIYMPSAMKLDTTGRTIFGFSVFLISCILMLGTKEGMPLIFYLGRIQKFKYGCHTYKKAKGNTAKYPTTQELIGTREVKGKLALFSGNRFVSVLKVIPIDTMLRPEAEKTEKVSFFCSVLNALNALGIHNTFIAKPSPYNTKPFLQPYVNNLKHYRPESEIHNQLQKTVVAFDETVEDFKVLGYDFYVVLSTYKKIHKEQLRGIKDTEERKRIKEKLKAKIEEEAETDLGRKRRVIAGALQGIDPEVVIIELEDEALEEALHNIYAPVTYPKAGGA